MKLTDKQRRSVLESVEDLFQEFKAKLLGKYYSGPAIYFEVTRQVNPLDTIEGLFRYGLAMLFGPAAEVDDSKIEKLANITGNYIDAEKLKLINRVSQGIDKANDADELRSILKEDFDKSTNYIEMLTATETRNVQSYSEQDGIFQVASSIGIEDPLVARLGPMDAKTCSLCKLLWHTAGNPRKPIVYKSSEIQGGYCDRKDPQPTWNATHPNCRHIWTMISPGFGFDEAGRVKYFGPGYDAWEDQNLVKTEDLEKAFRPYNQPDPIKTKEHDEYIKKNAGFISQAFGPENNDLMSQFINTIATHPQRHQRADTPTLGPLPRARHLVNWMKQSPSTGLKIKSPTQLLFGTTRHGQDPSIGPDEVLHDTWLFTKGQGFKHIRRQVLPKRIT